MSIPNTKEVFFAAVGDVHGQMHSMVQLISQWEREQNKEIDFVLQVGDFEPHRHEHDLLTMDAPSKYRKLGDFFDFFEGRTHFPWPVYFIGGNHEPYGFLEEIPSGAQLLKNCYYLGRTGSIQKKGLHIAGLSGIYSPNAFHQLRPPVGDISFRKNKDYIYFNEEDLNQLLELDHCDILLLHDWPAEIVDEKDFHLFQNKRRANEVEAIGNEWALFAMNALNPKLVLCGHMHFQYRKQIKLESRDLTQICCLANVAQGSNSIGIFSLDQTQEIKEWKTTIH